RAPAEASRGPSGQQVVGARGVAGPVDREVEILLALASLEQVVEEVAVLVLGLVTLEGLGLAPLELRDVDDVRRRGRPERGRRLRDIRRGAEEQASPEVRVAALRVLVRQCRAGERPRGEVRRRSMVVV